MLRAAKLSVEANCQAKSVLLLVPALASKAGLLRLQVEPSLESFFAVRLCLDAALQQN